MNIDTMSSQLDLTCLNVFEQVKVYGSKQKLYKKAYIE